MSMVERCFAVTPKGHDGWDSTGATIRSSIAYAESAERARSILDHRPDLGADYLALAGEGLARLDGLEEASGRLASLQSAST